MRTNVVLAISVALATSNLAWADTATTVPSDIQALSDQFFTVVKSGHTADAFRSAMVGIAAVVGENNIKAAADKSEEKIHQYGQVTDWTIVRTRTVAPTFIEQTYMLRCALAPMFFRIDFYNAGAKWKIVNISMTPAMEADQLGDLPKTENATMQ